MGRRMGMPKALLYFDGSPLLVRTVDTLRQVAATVIVVLSPGQRAPETGAGVSLVTDLQPGRGPLMGLSAGLAASDTDLNLVVGCDMPFVNGALLSRMAAFAAGCDAAVPRAEGRVQPLHAVYSKSCLPIIRDLLDSGVRRLGALADAANTRWVEQDELAAMGEDGAAFLSLNTPEDVKRAEALAAGHGRCAVV